MFFFFSDSKRKKGYGYRRGRGRGDRYRYKYGGYKYRYGHYGYGRRGMEMASHQRAVANDVHAEFNDEANIQHLKEIFAEVERNKAQLKATH